MFEVVDGPNESSHCGEVGQEQMKYGNKRVFECNGQELLHALIRFYGLSDGPRKVQYGDPVKVCDVGIGDNSTATITIFSDDIETLNTLVNGVNSD